MDGQQHLSALHAERNRWRRLFKVVLGVVILTPVAVAAYAIARFGVDRPVTYDSPEEHFKYGSTGGERESGFPFWIWQALPQVCAEHLPGKGYASLGMIYEGDKDLPVGVSKRRHLGIDRVFLNCAACHASTVREAPAGPSRVYTAMPAHRFDLLGFSKFFFECAGDAKFRAEFIVPEIERQAGKLGPLDRYVVYPVAIALMRERLLMLRERLAFTERQPEWGPGRTDTFTPAKTVLFNVPAHQLSLQESIGIADFPGIWNQRKKIGMQLHWDGNNGKSVERNKNAAGATGTTPPTIDLAALARVEQWLLDLAPPRYPFPISEQLAAKGAPIYKQYCAGCHGASGQKFASPTAGRELACLKPGERDDDLYGPQVGKITRIEEIGTDRYRLDSFTYPLVANLGSVYAGYDYRFCHFRKTFGYANMPLDGLWLRAPYLHNGSVPSLRELLEPGDKRPKTFYRGNDLFDQAKVGFVSDVAEEQGRKYFKFETALPGNGNRGHEGNRYGTELSPEDKDALVEYLKTF